MRLGDRAKHWGRALPRALFCGAVLALSAPAASHALELIGRDTAELRWTPSSGEVSAYVVFVSRDGGPYRSEQYTPLPRARVAGSPGETIRVRVRAYGVEDGGTLSSEASAPSEPIRFAATPSSAAPPAPLPAKPAPALPRAAPATNAASTAAPGVEQIPGFQFVPPLRVETSGDLDGDGDLDLLVTLGSWRHPLALFLEDGSLEQVATLSARNGTTNALAADFDGDGTDELALQSASEVALFRVDPNGQMALLRRVPIAAGTRLLAADLDGDGSATLVTYEPESGRLVEQLAAKGADFGSIRPLHALLAGDFDGDGRDDLWVQARPGPDAEIWLMDGAGGFQVSSLRLSRAPTAAVTADVDGDGRDDLAAYDPTRDELRAWLLDGGRVVSERTLARGPVESVQRGDMDGDGLDDLLLRAPDGTASALILSR
jgi:hypothetical protein